MAVLAAGTIATEADIGRVVEAYALRDADAVVGYLRAHPEVVAPLLGAIAVVPRYFGPDACLVLELEHDRDGTGGPLLWALIQTRLDVDPSLAALRRFDDDWGFAAIERARSRVMFSIESA